MRTRLAVLAATVLAACGVTSADIGTGENEELGTDEALLANDSADRACQLTLRSVGRTQTATGYTTRCNANGVCFYVWDGVLDVSASAPTGSKPYVLYRSTDQTTWSKKLASATSGAPEGFKRYKFHLETNTVSVGMSPTSMQRAKLELSPYLLLANGARLFDHNRLAGDFEVYALNSNNSWSLQEEAGVCRAVGQNQATLQFTGTWQTNQHGALVPGGKGVIEYDLSRLTACRGTHNGYPAWDTIATVRFSPGGQQTEGSVRAFDAPNGIPDQTRLHSIPLEFTVPAGATRAEIWFYNTGLWCTPTWDSNHGSNYSFDIVPPVAPVQWFGNTRASTSRACVADYSAPDTLTVDGYIRERACSFIEADVYVPGLTDAGPELPQNVLARAELVLDGVALAPIWMPYQGRFGNDYRFRFDLPRDTLYYGAKWTSLKYTLAYSTDGVVWRRDVQRTVLRDATWCNPSWGSCAL